MDNAKKLAQGLIKNLNKDTQDTQETQEVKEKNKKIKEALSFFPRNEQIKSIFEPVAKAQFLLALQKRIFEISTYGFLISLAFNLILTIVVFFVLFPLKEKEPYLVTFSTQEQNFAIVQKADTSITSNEALRRQLIGAYILNREVIDRIDDKAKREIVRAQSSFDVWRTFEGLVANEESIYTNEHLTRTIKIINISLKNKTYATADVEISLLHDGSIQSIKRYVISLTYGFEPQKFDFTSLPKNPTGFIVKRYAITEVEILKELDDENKVLKTKSKIKKVSKEEQVLEDAYIYQQNKNKNNDEHKDENEINPSMPQDPRVLKSNIEGDER